jgi:hypothetical protein
MGKESCLFFWQTAGCLFTETLSRSLTKILKTEDLVHNAIQDRKISVIEAAISIAPVVTILITAPETLTEVIVVISPVYIIAVITVVCVPIGIRVFVAAATPTVVAVGSAGAEDFLMIKTRIFLTSVIMIVSTSRQALMNNYLTPMSITGAPYISSGWVGDLLFTRSTARAERLYCTVGRCR